MARIALISRNPAMSMGLSATDHTVDEIRPSDLDDWLLAEEDIGFDALVLDLGSPSTASRLVGDLRASGRWIPVLLVATNEPSWSDEAVRPSQRARPLLSDRPQQASERCRPIC